MASFGLEAVASSAPSAIGAIVSSNLALPGQVVLLAVFNALYGLPLAAILVTHSLFGERAETFLTRARETIERLSPVVLTVLTLAAGVAWSCTARMD